MHPRLFLQIPILKPGLEIMPKSIKILLASILAGVLIGFGGLAYLLSSTDFGNLGKLIGALLFPAGLYLICETKALLYTGKIGFIANRQYNVAQYLIILAGNLLGAGIFGLLTHLMFHESYNFDFILTGRVLLDWLDATNTLLKSFFCGILVYLAVYLYQTESGSINRFLVILIPIALFVLLGFRHCIADIFYYAVNLHFSWQAIVSLAIVICGNSLGAIGTHHLLKFYTQ